MKYSKKAGFLFSILIITNIVAIISFIIVNNSLSLQNHTTLNAINLQLDSGIFNKTYLGFQFSKTLNSNGSGFIDNISCPQNIIMSGGVNRSGGLSSTLTYSGSMFCSGTYNSEDFFIYFNQGFTGFYSSEYAGENIILSGKQATFSDRDNTRIDFSGTPDESDGIDDDFNDDDYRVGSSGSSYANNYSDDDIVARKTLYGYIPPDSGWKNIFWNNQRIQTYIDDNTNNSDTINVSLTGAGVKLFLDTDQSFDLKIIHFDRNRYNDFSELIVNTNQQLSFSSGARGYIQDDLSISGNITGNEYSFDFSQNDYGVFLKNTSQEFLFYQLLGESSTGSGMYINPINDSFSGEIKILGYNIILSDGKYIGKFLEIGKKK